MMKIPGILRCDRSVVILAAATTLLHLLTTAGYGIFRDELYYLACSERLAFGYVDHPPLVAVLLRVVRHTLGDSLFALRAFPALAAGALVILTACVTRELGGGRYARFLAGLAAALAPQYLGMLSIYSMNALDLIVWAALALVLVRILKSDDRSLWPLFGVIAGIGLQNKLSVLFLGFGVAVGLVIAREWRHLRDRRLWFAAGIAALLFAPHVLWQIANGWPTLEFIANATATKNIAFSPAAFFVEQIMIMNPIAFPLWLAGLGFFLFAKEGRPWRTIGFAYLAVMVLMMSRSAKPYYLSPFYPVLFAAGALVFERVARLRYAGWLRPATVIMLVLSGAALAPVAKPLLPVDTYVAYAERLGIAPGSDERHETGRLPQFFADMHGWQELAHAVAAVYDALPAEDRDRACIFARHYGQAGAIDFYGPGLGLPRAIAGHNNYWLWGPGDCDGGVMIVIGGEREDHERSFAVVEEAGLFTCRDCLPMEDNQVLYVCRDLRASPADIWARVKHYD